MNQCIRSLFDASTRGLSFLVLALMVACDDPVDPAPRGDGGAATGGIGKVQGTVSYTGSATGTLSVTLFKSFPPDGTPPAAKRRIPAATFPQAFELDAPVGTYKAACFLDVGDDSPVEPGTGDPQCIPVDVTVADGATATTALTIRP